MKEIVIGLNINGGIEEEFSFSLDDENASHLEQLYRSRSQQDGFKNEDFWPNLKKEDEQLYKTICNAIVDELYKYIFNDDQFSFCDDDDIDLNVQFPLYDLHFDYLTSEGKKTMRHMDCTKAVIYDDNVFNCDFEYTFD